MDKDAQELVITPYTQPNKDQLRPCTGKNCSDLKPVSDFYSKVATLSASADDGVILAARF